MGIFEGNEYTVKNIYISKAEGENSSIGLFGTAVNSQINDVTVIGQINVNNDDGIRVGLVCGEAYNSVLANCTTYGRIDATTKANVLVGGVLGYLSTYSNIDEVREYKMKACRNNASVNATGICSRNVFEINYFVGGVVGFSEGTITQCSNHGEVNATSKNNGYDYFYTLGGGICGNSSGEINNCYNVGDVNAVGTKYVFAGGISAHWYQIGDIYNCYNIGQVHAELQDSPKEYALSAAGGIIGATEPLWIMESGMKAESTVCVKNCYYLNNVEKAYGEVIPQNQFNVKSLTIDEFAKQDSFVGFDFENIWKMSDTQNKPILRNESNIDVFYFKTKTGKSVEIEGIDKNNIHSCVSVDKKVAVIDNNKNIKGLSVGTTDIMITMNDGSVIQCNVTVDFSIFWLIINFLFGWLI